MRSEKSCLLGALRDDPWEEGRATTHGIEIKPFKVTDPTSGTEITLNGWDFGGQRVLFGPHINCSSVHPQFTWLCGSRAKVRSRAS